MENEILFRGERIDNHELVEGDLVHELEGVCIAKIERLNRRDIIKGVMFKKRVVLVDPATICPFIGLTDIEGNKVFLTDTVFCKETGAVGKIVYDNFQIKIKWESPHHELRQDVLFWFTERTMYVRRQ